MAGVHFVVVVVSRSGFGAGVECGEEGGQKEILDCWRGRGCGEEKETLVLALFRCRELARGRGRA